MSHFLRMMLILISVAITVFSACASEGPQIEAPDVVLDVRSEESYRVGEDVIRIHVTATDPQGLDLEFAVIDPPGRATFQTFRSSAVFTWDPIASDVTVAEPRRLVFAVTNERGVTTERVVRVHIHAGNTEPRFLNSASELYDPNSGQPLQITVRVRDDDSPQVFLSMPVERAPEGAQFEQTDNFQGTFTWMPSPVQMERRMHSVVFIAEDDDNPPVEYQVTIIIQAPSDPTGPGPGTGPSEQTCAEVETIEHQPLQAQRTSQSYAIEGSIGDGSVNWDEAAVYWTVDDPRGGSPFYSASTLQLEGNQFSGAIPNPLLDGGASAVFSYQICAFAFAAEEIACGPEEYLYRFIAYSPDDDKCRDDGISMASPGAAGEISTSNWQEYRVCEGGPKYHSMELAAGEEVELALLFSPGATPEITAEFDGAEVDVEMLSCLGWATVSLQGPGTAMIRVEEEDFPYHIKAFAQAGECPGEEYEPNNTPGMATLIASDFAVFDDMAICTADDIDIFAVELVRGDYLDAFLSFENSLGDLDMTLFAPSQVSDVVSGGFGVAQGWSTNDNESITYVAEESGFYYLSVVTSDEPNGYDLAVERSCEVDDQFAGNHSEDDAAFLELDEHQSLKLCEGQSDWYWNLFDGTSDGLWLGEVRPRYGSVSALEVTVYDFNGTQITQGVQAGNAVDFQFSPEPGEIYYFEVRANRPMIYDLTVLDFS